MNEQIAERVRIYPDSQLPCAVAHYIAAELGVSPLEVGETANEMGVRINMCQIGMFGYAASKGSPSYRIRQAAQDIPAEVAAAIQEATVDGCIPCEALWRIAEEYGMSRLEGGNAIEGLGIRVKPCQLGCF